jgi:methylglyoxal/glyoxal reductase
MKLGGTMKTITLANGVVVPQVALGTFRTTDEETYQSVLSALRAGYRHIDTATRYGTEAAVGRAIKESSIPRDQLFITTKVYKTHQGYEKTMESFHESLALLGLDYVDMYLIHWPTTDEADASTWTALEELYRAGKTRAIGVCNFRIHHLEHLMQTATIMPMVNQVEMHVELQQHRLQEFCQSHDIALQAYAPLMSFEIKDLLANPTLQAIAKTHHKTVPQIALAWLLQRGIIIIPKSKTPARISENLASQEITLTADEMQQIRGLNRARMLYPDADNIEI